MPASSQCPTVVSLPWERSSSRPAAEGAVASGGQPASGMTLPRPSACRVGSRRPPTACATVASVLEPWSPQSAGSGSSPAPTASSTTMKTRRDTPGSLSRAACAGMRALEGGPQGAVAEVRVDLRRRHGRVSEQLLHDAQIGPALDQVRRKGVAQDVRRHGLLDAGRDCVAAYDAEHALAGDAAPARVEQERGRLLLLAEERPPAREIAARG